jgi:hypothetical protein
VRLQYQQAHESGVAILQWRDPAITMTDILAIKDEQHSRLLTGQEVRTQPLTQLIHEVLQKLRSEPTPEPERALSATIFLAEATDDLERERESVRAYLKQLGLQILPSTDTEYASEAETYQQQVLQDITRSTLFVQLLGQSTGRRPRGYVLLQYEGATQAGKEILQWCKSDLMVADAELQQLISSSKTVLKMGLEDFKREVRDTLVRQQASPGHDQPQGQPHRWCLSTPINMIAILPGKLRRSSRSMVVRVSSRRSAVFPGLLSSNT